MRKKLLLFIIRLIRFFKAEDTYIPNLRAVPEGQVKQDKLYRYYGRILVARKWNGKVKFWYFRKDDKGDWINTTKIGYTEALMAKGPEHVRSERTGAACDLCYCQKQGLPCRCDFITGTNTGYYELVHSDTQYSDNIQL